MAKRLQRKSFKQAVADLNDGIRLGVALSEINHKVIAGQRPKSNNLETFGPRFPLYKRNQVQYFEKNQ